MAYGGDQPAEQAGGGGASMRPREDALRNVEGGSEDALPGDGGGLGYGVGERTLTHLMRLHPFLTFFCWVADRQFPASHRADTRVARLRERDPRFYWTCVTLDVVVTFLAVAILVAAATWALYKTLVL